MYLFTRHVLVNPAHLRAGMSQAVEMLQYVNQKTDLDASLYQVLQGAPLGTLTYGFRTESYAASVAATDALVRSDEYLEKVESGAEYFVGNPEDQLAEFLHVAGEIGAPPAVASIVTATMNAARAATAISWSIELANYMNNLTSLPTAVLTSSFGRYGQIGWLAYADSLERLEEAGAKTRGDPGFVQRLGDSADLFVPGSGESRLSRKIA